MQLKAVDSCFAEPVPTCAAESTSPELPLPGSGSGAGDRSTWEVEAVREQGGSPRAHWLKQPFLSPLACPSLEKGGCSFYTWCEALVIIKREYDSKSPKLLLNLDTSGDPHLSHYCGSLFYIV